MYRLCPYVARAKGLARNSYSRQWLARYLASISGSGLIEAEAMISRQVQKGGHPGLIRWLRSLYVQHPSVDLHAALIAETLAWKITRVQVYRNAAEITGEAA